jgi:hypothetical protein
VNAPVNLRNPIQPWENELWAPEPLFKGERVFCLASGPSLTREVVDKVRGKGRVVAVNSSVYLAPWADVLFFTDSGWFETGRDPALCGYHGDDRWPRRDFIEAFPGLVVCMSRAAKRVLPLKVKRIKGRGDPARPPVFPPPGSPEIQQGRTSGHTAISLAIGMGASRVVMLGYDMRLIPNGGPYTNPPTGSPEEREILSKSSHPRHYEIRARYHEHHHREYFDKPRDLFIYETDFIPAFRGWHQAARAIGVEIVNCTPGSAIPEFPFADLDEVLAECARS